MIQRRFFCSKGRNILHLRHRGLIKDIFPKEKSQELAGYLSSGSRTVYAGFDPSASSLHIGNLLVLNTLLHFQRAGHRVIALIGEATAGIGDPSGKIKERPRLKSKILKANSDGISENICRIFENHAKEYSQSLNLIPPLILNNSDWYSKMTPLQLFSSVGRHIRVGRMLSRSSVKNRLESEEGISFTEFSYQVFQAYDWYKLKETFECCLQIGGSDQMGNILTGHELISKVSPGSIWGLTLPLLTSKATGHKLGKSEETKDSIWLSPNLTTPFAFYQYFLRLSDADVCQMLPLLSLRPYKEITELKVAQSQVPSRRKAQRSLASEMTKLVHGEKGLDLAEKTTSILYENSLEALGSLNPETLKDVFEQSNYFRLLYTPGLSLLQLCTKIGIFSNESDAIRVISSGGCSINQRQTTDFNEIILPENHILPNDITLLRVGKRHYVIVEWTF